MVLENSSADHPSAKVGPYNSFYENNNNKNSVFNKSAA